MLAKDDDEFSYFNFQVNSIRLIIVSYKSPQFWILHILQNSIPKTEIEYGYKNSIYKSLIAAAKKLSTGDRRATN